MTLLSKQFNIICGFLKDLDKGDIFALASQLAYSLVLAFFPFLMFLITLMGFLKLDETGILTTLSALLPSNAYELIEETLRSILTTRNGNLLSFSLLLAIWTSSTGFTAVIKGLNKAYGIQECRGFIKTTLLSIAFTFVIAIIIIATLVLLVFGDMIGEFIVGKVIYVSAVKTIWDWIRYTIVVMGMAFTFGVIYKFTPCKAQTVMDVVPGALFTTTGWIMVSVGFSYYVNNIANYSRLYGGIGAVVVLMIWIYLSSLILLIGGYINAWHKEKRMIY